MEANATLRAIVRHDNGGSHREMLTRMCGQCFRRVRRASSDPRPVFVGNDFRGDLVIQSHFKLIALSVIGNAG